MGRRELNKAKKRAALLSAGLEVFGERGFDRATVEQIASHAHVARGTYYLYFDDKGALFEAVIDAFFEPLMAIFDQVEQALERAEGSSDALSVYQGMALQLAGLGLAHRDRLLVIFREMRGQGMPGLRSRELALIARVTSLTRLAQERGLVAPGDPQLASLVILGGIERLFFEALVGEIALGDPGALAGRAAVVLSRVLGIQQA